MTVPVFFLDVNVPMYAAGTDHPHRAACVWVMEEIAESRLRSAIDAEIIQEILHRFGSIRQWELGARMAVGLLDLVPTVYPITVAEARRSVELFKALGGQGVTARDTLHVAAMQSNGLTHIISADRHFDRIDGIVRIGVETLDQTRHDVRHAQAALGGPA